MAEENKKPAASGEVANSHSNDFIDDVIDNFGVDENFEGDEDYSENDSDMFNTKKVLPPIRNVPENSSAADLAYLKYFADGEVNNMDNELESMQPDAVDDPFSVEGPDGIGFVNPEDEVNDDKDASDEDGQESDMGVGGLANRKILENAVKQARSDDMDIENQELPDDMKDVVPSAIDRMPASQVVQRTGGNGSSYVPDVGKPESPISESSVANDLPSANASYFPSQQRANTVRKLKDLDAGYLADKRNQAILEKSFEINKEVAETLALIKETNMNISDMLSKVNATGAQLRKEYNGIQKLTMGLDIQLDKSNNFFSDRYLDNLQKSAERMLSQYLDTSRNQYMELFQSAVKNYRDFSSAAMKFQRAMESRISKEFRFLVRMVMYGVPALIILNLVLIGIVVWKLVLSR